MVNLGTEELSDREREILRLVATGASNKEIAQQLFISSNTVKAHLRNIFAKIGAASRTEAAMYCVRMGLVETESRHPVAENVTPVIEQAPTFPKPTEIEPDLVIKPAQATSPLLWIFGIVLLIVTLILVAIGIRLIINGNPTANLTASAPPTATPIQQWFLLDDLPTPRKGLATAGYEGEVYAIAGESANGPTGFAEKYDPLTGTWSALASKPLHVADASAAVIGGQIYIPGGRVSSGAPTRNLEIFDPLQNSWKAGADLPVALSAYAMVAFEGRLYLFGGWDGQQYLDSVYIYNPDLDIWSEGPSMPSPRAFAGAAAIDNKIFVLGGTDGKQALTANDIYQPGLEETPWSQGAPLPGGRYAMGVANIADIVHVFGGKDTESSPTGLAYFAQQDEWRQIETPLQPGCSSLAIATLGTRLYMLGGTTAEGLNKQVWSYQAIFMITLPLVR